MEKIGSVTPSGLVPWLTDLVYLWHGPDSQSPWPLPACHSSTGEWKWLPTCQPTCPWGATPWAGTIRWYLSEKTNPAIWGVICVRGKPCNNKEIRGLSISQPLSDLISLESMYFGQVLGHHCTYRCPSTVSARIFAGTVMTIKLKLFSSKFLRLLIITYDLLLLTTWHHWKWSTRRHEISHHFDSQDWCITLRQTDHHGRYIWPSPIWCQDTCNHDDDMSRLVGIRSNILLGPYLKRFNFAAVFSPINESAYLCSLYGNFQNTRPHYIHINNL